VPGANGGAATSPDAALPELADDDAQALAGVAPVGEDVLLGAVRGADLDRVDDGGVLADRRSDLVDEGRDVESDVALALRLDRVVQCQEAGARPRLGAGAMESLIELEDPVVVRARDFDRCGELFIDCAEVTDEAGAAFRVAARRPLRRETLDLGDDREQLPGVLLRQRRDGGKSVVSRG
jgi:hypothetical protein